MRNTFRIFIAAVLTAVVLSGNAQVTSFEAFGRTHTVKDMKGVTTEYSAKVHRCDWSSYLIIEDPSGFCAFIDAAIEKAAEWDSVCVANGIEQINKEISSVSVASNRKKPVVSLWDRGTSTISYSIVTSAEFKRVEGLGSFIIFSFTNTAKNGSERFAEGQVILTYLNEARAFSYAVSEENLRKMSEATKNNLEMLK